MVSSYGSALRWTPSVSRTPPVTVTALPPICVVNVSPVAPSALNWSTALPRAGLVISRVTSGVPR